MLDWLGEHEGLLASLGAVSVATLVACALLLPWFVARLPADYFTRDSRHDGPGERLPPAGLVLRGLKNVVGFVLLLAGLAMLVLPGQGILTIFVGLTLMNFPGKFRLERWLVRRPAVLRALNWLRARRGAPPLLSPDAADAGEGSAG